jgi:hypothetical protein
MIEIEVYAKGLRDGNTIMQLHSQMDLVPRVRYKIDDHHDLVYFEFDEGTEVTQKQITSVFRQIGLEPRFVGQTADSLPPGTAKVRLR